MEQNEHDTILVQYNVILYTIRYDTCTYWSMRAMLYFDTILTILRTRTIYICIFTYITYIYIYIQYTIPDRINSVNPILHSTIQIWYTHICVAHILVLIHGVWSCLYFFQAGQTALRHYSRWAPQKLKWLLVFFFRLEGNLVIIQ